MSNSSFLLGDGVISAGRRSATLQAPYRPQPIVRRRRMAQEAQAGPLAIAISQRDDTVLVDRQAARRLARALLRAAHG